MNQESNDHLISTCFSFGVGRDIEAVVEHDGISYWTDRGNARQIVGTGLKAFLGNEEAMNYRQRVYDEHVFAVPIPEAGLKEIREVLAPQYWAEPMKSVCNPG